MRDLLGFLADWADADPEMAVVTVVRTSGSTPRPPGARLLVTRDGRTAGSVSGGCLEAALIAEAQATLAGMVGPRVLHYGISDELGWEVGLSCGGTVDVFVEVVRWRGPDAALEAVREEVAGGRPVVLLTVVEGDRAGMRAAVTQDGRVVGGLAGVAGHEALSRTAADRLQSGEPATGPLDGFTVFADPILPQPRLAIVGAVHIAIPLCRIATAAGYAVTVIDPRPALLTGDRFPDAAALIQRWPGEGLAALGLGPGDAAACLAHDRRFEEPALAALLRGTAGYIGAIGSRGTHRTRLERLHQAGFGERDIARVHGPIGLDIGATTPEEIAVAIIAEVVAVRRGRHGRERPAPAGLAGANQ